MNTVPFDRGEAAVQLIAHRGCSGLETENTCAAFVAAGSRSYFGVETDVHVTADGRFIIHHDDTALRTAGQPLRLEETHSNLLRSLPLYDIPLANATGQCLTRTDLRMPFLAEYIRICKRYEKTCVLELKNAMTPAAIAGIVQDIRAEGWLPRTVFISFYHENLVELRRLLANQQLQFLTGDTPDEALLQKLLPWGLDLDIAYPSLTREGVALMHANGIKVNCWTVDDPADAARLARWGVDFITTNILEG